MDYSFQKQKKYYKSNQKPKKIWVDKSSEFYNISMKSWLAENAIEVYSTHNEDKPVVAEKFIRTSKNKIQKYMTSMSKRLYINKSGDIVNKYKNTYYSTIKMKPVDVKSNTYINCSEEINDENLKFKIDNSV